MPKSAMGNRSVLAYSSHTQRTAGTARTSVTALGPQRSSNSAVSQPPSRPQTAGDISSYAPPGIKLNGPNAEELEELIHYYDNLLEQRDQQVMQLTSMYESEQRRAAMLESELGLALAASNRAEAAHATELAKVEGDVARVLAERRGLLEKLQGIEIVEDAVREMVVQMKLRVGDDERPSPEQLQAEKEALRGENILTVLGSLRSILKTLWTFKVESEEDMRCSRMGRAQQHGQLVLGLKAQIRQMEAAVRRAQQEAAAAEVLAQEETAAREAVLAESQEVLAAMEAQQAEVVAALRAATEEAAAARRALAAAQEEGRRRDGLVLKNQQLESARHFDRVAQDKELRQMQNAHNRQMGGMTGELAKISDLMMQNDQLRDRLKELLRSRDQMKAEMRTVAHSIELAPGQQRSSRSQLDGASSVLRSSSLLTSHRPATAGGGGYYGRAGGGGGVAASASLQLAPSTATGAASRLAARPSTAAQLLAVRRATAEEQAKAAAEEQEQLDPMYATWKLTNVSKLNKSIKSAIRDLKRDLAEAAPSWAKEQPAPGGPPASARAMPP